MEINAKIEAKNYVATEHDVELLAQAHMVGTDAARRSDGSYLRILVATVQAQFGPTKRKRFTEVEAREQSEFLRDTHARLYPSVLKGVDIPDDPLGAAGRNGRAAFARTSCSTLQLFIKAGGDVRTLEVATVTKGGLRKWALNATGSLPEHLAPLVAALGRVERSAAKLAEDDPDGARDTISQAMERLQRILDELLGPNGNGNHQGTESQVFQRNRGAAFRPARQAQAA